MAPVHIGHRYRRLAGKAIGCIRSALQCLPEHMLDLLRLALRTRARARTSGAHFNGYL